MTSALKFSSTGVALHNVLRNWAPRRQLCRHADAGLAPDGVVLLGVLQLKPGDGLAMFHLLAGPGVHERPLPLLDEDETKELPKADHVVVVNQVRHGLFEHVAQWVEPLPVAQAEVFVEQLKSDGVGEIASTNPPELLVFLLELVTEVIVDLHVSPIVDHPVAVLAGRGIPGPGGQLSPAVVHEVSAEVAELLEEEIVEDAIGLHIRLRRAVLPADGGLDDRVQPMVQVHVRVEIPVVPEVRVVRGHEHCLQEPFPMDVDQEDVAVGVVGFEFLRAGDAGPFPTVGVEHSKRLQEHAGLGHFRAHQLNARQATKEVLGHRDTVGQDERCPVRNVLLLPSVHGLQRDVQCVRNVLLRAVAQVELEALQMPRVVLLGLDRVRGQGPDVALEDESVVRHQMDVARRRAPHAEVFAVILLAERDPAEHGMGCAEALAPRPPLVVDVVGEGLFRG